MIDQVREHIRLLSIFHYVVGGIGYLVSMIPCIHLAIGIFFLVAPEETFHPPEPPAATTESAHSEVAPGEPAVTVAPFPARLFGLLFTVIASFIILTGFTVSTFIVVTGRRLASYRSHTFCMIVGGIECLFMPFGTVLGIFTILTLIKPEARQLFGLPSYEGGEGAMAG
jgi:hypothetical protein